MFDIGQRVDLVIEGKEPEYLGRFRVGQYVKRGEDTYLDALFDLNDEKYGFKLKKDHRCFFLKEQYQPSDHDERLPPVLTPMSEAPPKIHEMDHRYSEEVLICIEYDGCEVVTPGRYGYIHKVWYISDSYYEGNPDWKLRGWFPIPVYRLPEVINDKSTDSSVS